MSTPDERAYGELLEALAKYLADPKNLKSLLNAFEQAVAAMVQPYVERLSSAYRRVYRRPTARNCGVLMRVEAEPPMLYDPHRFYRNMRDQLVKGFSLLESHPVFSNLYLKRDLLALKRRTLTLFFTPQLIRPKDAAPNQRTLLDATSRLAELDRVDFDASLFFLRRSLNGSGQAYNPHLLANLSFLAYRRFESSRLAGAAARRECRNLDAIVARARRHPVRSRTLMGRSLVDSWSADARAPEALETWAAMVAGTSSYSLRSISAKLR